MPEGHCEQHEADRVVQRDYRQQEVSKRPPGLVLAHDHERRGRSSRGGDGAEGDGCGNGQHIGTDKMEYHKRDIDQHRRGHGLKNADDKRLLAGSP